MRLREFLQWLSLGGVLPLDRCDHEWYVVRVVHGSYKGLVPWNEGPLVTIAHWRCSKCGKLRTTEIDGWWRREDISRD